MGCPLELILVKLRSNNNNRRNAILNKVYKKHFKQTPVADYLQQFKTLSEEPEL